MIDNRTDVKAIKRLALNELIKVVKLFVSSIIINAIFNYYNIACKKR